MKLSGQTENVSAAINDCSQSPEGRYLIVKVPKVTPPLKNPRSANECRLLLADSRRCDITGEKAASSQAHNLVQTCRPTVQEVLYSTQYTTVLCSTGGSQPVVPKYRHETFWSNRERVSCNKRLFTISRRTISHSQSPQSQYF